MKKCVFSVFLKELTPSSGRFEGPPCIYASPVNLFLSRGPLLGASTVEMVSQSCTSSSYLNALSQCLCWWCLRRVLRGGFALWRVLQTIHVKIISILIPIFFEPLLLVFGTCIRSVSATDPVVLAGASGAKLVQPHKQTLLQKQSQLQSWTLWTGSTREQGGRRTVETWIQASLVAGVSSKAPGVPAVLALRSYCKLNA